MNQKILDGWNYHDTETERLTAELKEWAGELTCDDTLPFLKLAIHTLGEHQGRWHELNEVVESMNHHDQAYRHAVLAVSYFMTDRGLQAQSEELSYMKSGDSLLAYFEVKLLMVRALVFSGQYPSANELYQSVFSVIPADSAQPDFLRQIAIICNTLANELMSVADRTDSVRELMKASAFHSLMYWSQCGNWVNRERAFYQLSLVHLELGEAGQAVEFAQEGIHVIEANGNEPVDEAFLRLVLARAFLKSGRSGEAEQALSQADQLASQWQDDSLTDWYQEERTKLEMEAQPA
ncbi:hypothetical protein [Endozoicomonas arenosclerae]|uniref:hypothetical protein n=1 Tax=Endozoicomonas arenosclerae TaxID=1633495 RepID=UPI0007808455|nr:hypothetical protein [Endozoicomonas arenosclerae]